MRAGSLTGHRQGGPRLERAPMTTTCSPTLFQVTECVTEAVGRELLQRLLQREMLMNQKNDQKNKDKHQLQGPGGTKPVHLIAHLTLGTLCSRPHHHSSHCVCGASQGSAGLWAELRQRDP